MSHDFLWGALSMACLVSGLFFLRYYRQSRDRFFLFFSIAFFVFALNWLGLSVVPREHESRHYVYVVRLIAFVLLLVAIAAKNRRPR